MDSLKKGGRCRHVRTQDGSILGVSLFELSRLERFRVSQNWPFHKEGAHAHIARGVYQQGDHNSRDKNTSA